MSEKLKLLIRVKGFQNLEDLLYAAVADSMCAGSRASADINCPTELKPGQPRGRSRRPTTKPALVLAAAGEQARSQRNPFGSPDRAAPPYQFSDRELVQYVTGMGATKANDLLHMFGDASAVIGASDSDLAAHGIDMTTARRIRAFQLAAAAHHWRRLVRRTVLGCWNDLLDYLSVGMAAKGTEEFHVLFLDRKNALLADEVMGNGTVDHAPVYPREIVKRSLALNASAIILAHNHPSGDPTPSRADIEMTREVVEACKALRIAVHDHVVIGRGGTASLKALGLM